MVNSENIINSRIIIVILVFIGFFYGSCLRERGKKNMSRSEIIFPKELNEFVNTLENIEDISITDTFWGYDSLVSYSSENKRVFYNHFGYVFDLKQGKKEESICIIQYKLDSISDWPAFLNFFRESGYVKSPFIFMVKGNTIFGLTTSSQRNIPGLLQFFNKTKIDICESHKGIHFITINFRNNEIEECKNN
ncbi:MAG: hypothetical protein R3A43_04985 [Bacteroidia bacterium]